MDTKNGAKMRDSHGGVQAKKRVKIRLFFEPIFEVKRLIFR